MTLRLVPPPPAPPAVEVLACGQCGHPLIARVPLLLDGELVPIEAAHLLGDVVLVRRPDGWRARPVAVGEHPAPLLRRRTHRCPRYLGGYPCSRARAGTGSPACGRPGRPYADGNLCADHERALGRAPIGTTPNG